jgi:hypothetical protein
MFEILRASLPDALRMTRVFYQWRLEQDAAVFFTEVGLPDK